MRPVLFFVVALALSSVAVAGAPSAVAAQEQILQLALNDHELEQYLHPEASGRVPVRVAGAGVSTHIKLKKFGVPVRVVSSSDHNGPLLLVTQLVISADAASLQVEYPIEGVFGNFIFANHAGRWAITEAHVYER